MFEDNGGEIPSQNVLEENKKTMEMNCHDALEDLQRAVGRISISPLMLSEMNQEAMKELEEKVENYAALFSENYPVGYLQIGVPELGGVEKGVWGEKEQSKEAIEGHWNKLLDAGLKVVPVDQHATLARLLYDSFSRVLKDRTHIIPGPFLGSDYQAAIEGLYNEQTLIPEKGDFRHMADPQNLNDDMKVLKKIAESPQLPLGVIVGHTMRSLNGSNPLPDSINPVATKLIRSQFKNKDVLLVSDWVYVQSFLDHIEPYAEKFKPFVIKDHPYALKSRPDNSVAHQMTSIILMISAGLHYPLGVNPAVPYAFDWSQFKSQKPEEYKHFETSVDERLQDIYRLSKDPHKPPILDLERFSLADKLSFLIQSRIIPKSSPVEGIKIPDNEADLYDFKCDNEYAKDLINKKTQPMGKRQTSEFFLRNSLIGEYDIRDMGGYWYFMWQVEMVEKAVGKLGCATTFERLELPLEMKQMIQEGKAWDIRLKWRTMVEDWMLRLLKDPLFKEVYSKVDWEKIDAQKV